MQSLLANDDYGKQYAPFVSAGAFCQWGEGGSVAPSNGQEDKYYMSPMCQRHTLYFINPLESISLFLVFCAVSNVRKDKF